MELFNCFFSLLYNSSLNIGRIAPVFYMLPFLNQNILTGTTRFAVMFIVAIGMFPLPSEMDSNIREYSTLLIIVKEVFIGLILGVILTFPFWVFLAFGSIIDNQRGATLSSTIDPANGIDTSEMSNFLNWFACSVYLQNGGMRLVLDTLRKSYDINPVNTLTAPDIYSVIELINECVSRALLLCAPIISMLLFSEIILGLLSRFAPQMNAFSVSLTVKSAVAFIVLILYFGGIVSNYIFDLFLDVSSYL
ncbi:SpaR/YscT/HrcT type III secretion system export apparatus protein [Escherichia coli]|nr:SpaR/YscT/HrcT type III secretion system export apparatus protein [Escherichia coli]EFO2135280.1 SpaR/YscT/HrcT type III secretion system export apparatus protein [Escherichia coli]